MLFNTFDQLPIEALSMITGKLLGDGNLFQQDGRQARFRFSHCKADKEWTYHCFERMSPFFLLSPPAYRKILDKRIIKGCSENYYVQSKSHVYFTTLRKIWYPNKKKIIPFDFVAKYLNPLCLAWWYQDDGSLKRKDKILKKIILSTESFTVQENKELIKLLFLKFHLSFSIDKQNRLLLYNQKQILYFLHLVKPYMHASMKRKYYLLSELPEIEILKKRTTISLPNSIILSSPTKDIHKFLENLPTLLNILKNNNGYETFFINDFFLEETSNSENKKSYQIILLKKHLQQLKECQNICGLTNNQLVELCRVISINKNLI